MKKPALTLRLNRETLTHLDRPAMEQVGGAALTKGVLCTPTLGSCGHICP